MEAKDPVRHPLSGNTRAAVGARQIAVQDGVQVPACRAFPGQGNWHTRQILSARCVPLAPRPLLPNAPVNKLYNGHHDCLQNPSCLLDSAQLEVVAQTPPGLPVLPMFSCLSDAQSSSRARLTACHCSASIQQDGICEGKVYSPVGHTCVCKPP